MTGTDDIAADRFGRLAATLWPGGMDVFGTMRVGLTEEDLDDLAPVAKQVRLGDLDGVAFLAEVAPRLGAGGVRAFLDALDAWEEQDKTAVTAKKPKAAAAAAVDVLSEIEESFASFLLDSEPAQALIGKTLGGFEVLSLLGEGSYGRVYKAVQRSLKREVALKVLSPKLQQDEDYVQSLQAEARIAAQLRHPNVVAVIDLGICSETSRVFVAFEFVDGESAQSLMRRKERLPEADALTICLGIAEALACAEEHGVVHRDVKPDNILIGADGIPKLGDLGLARRVEEAGGATSLGFVVGTPHYISPEQALGEDALDIRTDLYSLGICLYWFVTGQRPFFARSPIEIIAKHVNEEVPDPRDVDSAISPRVSQLVAWLTRRDRDERYSSARSAVESLKRVLAGKPPLRPHGTGRVITSKRATATGVRQGPTALPPGEQPRPAPSLTDRWSRGRAFGDNVSRIGIAAQDTTKGSSEETEEAAPTMILSEDMARAYQLRGRLGKVPTGKLYDAAIVGDQTFEGFAHPVVSAVVKIPRSVGIWTREQEVYAQPDRRLPLLLDAGKILEKQPYLVFETLQPPPSDRFSSREGPCRFDPATACDVFLNLLESLQGLHSRPKRPLVLCSIKPRGIMLRVPSEDGALSDDLLLQRLQRGNYEPVFADLSCVQEGNSLRTNGGKVKATLGNPLYLPPESAPRARGAAFVPGTYSVKTDVYGLCLTWYVHLTADRPYGRKRLYKLSGLDYLRELITLKRGGISPVDVELLVAILGERGTALLPILQQGLHPDPEQRATTRSLLRLAGEILGAVETRRRDDPPQHCDSPQLQLRLRQRLFSALLPGGSHYPRR